MQKQNEKQVKKERNPVFRFGGKILLQSGFGFYQSHICIQILIVCQNKKIKRKKSVEKKRKKKTQKSLHSKSFLFLHTFISKNKLYLVGYLHLV